MLPKSRWAITKNQIPVVNLLIPIFTGERKFSLVVLRKENRLVLPGGYIESGKTWQEVCLDVCRFEVRVRMDDGTRFWPIDCFTSNHKSVFILFAQTPSIKMEDLLRWRRKKDKRIILSPGLHKMAFEHHTEMVCRFFGFLPGEGK